MKTVLVLFSMTRTLELFEEEKLTADDLAAALFCFGCVRGQAFHANREQWIIKLMRDRNKKVSICSVSAFLTLLDLGESLGRVAWYRNQEPQRAIQDFTRVLANAGLRVPGFDRMSFYETGGLKRNDTFVATALQKWNNHRESETNVRVICNDSIK